MIHVLYRCASCFVVVAAREERATGPVRALPCPACKTVAPAWEYVGKVKA